MAQPIYGLFKNLKYHYIDHSFIALLHVTIHVLWQPYWSFHKVVVFFLSHIIGKIGQWNIYRLAIFLKDTSNSNLGFLLYFLTSNMPRDAWKATYTYTNQSKMFSTWYFLYYIYILFFVIQIDRYSIFYLLFYHERCWYKNLMHVETNQVLLISFSISFRFSQNSTNNDITYSFFKTT